MNNVMQRTPRTLHEASGQDCTITAIAQGFRFGKVGLRLTESKDDIPVRSFCSYIRASLLESLLEALRNPLPMGTVLLDCEDNIPASVCADKGYRKDGKAIFKRLFVTAIPGDRVLFTSTIQAANETSEGTIIPDGEAVCHAIEVPLCRSATMRLVIAMFAAYHHYISQRGRPKQRVHESQLDIEYA